MVLRAYCTHGLLSMLMTRHVEKGKTQEAGLHFEAVTFNQTGA